MAFQCNIVTSTMTTSLVRSSLVDLLPLMFKASRHEQIVVIASKKPSKERHVTAYILWIRVGKIEHCDYYNRESPVAAL